MRQFVTFLDYQSVERAIQGAIEGCDVLSRADDVRGVTHPPCYVLVVQPNDSVHDVEQAIRATRAYAQASGQNVSSPDSSSTDVYGSPRESTVLSAIRSTKNPVLS